MATLTITNTSAADVYCSDLYVTIAAGASVETTRSASDLSRMSGLQSLIAAGTCTVSVAYTDAERNSGLSQGGAGESAGVEPTHVVDLATAAGLAANTYDATAKTITLDATGTLTVDSVLTVLGDRILVKDEGDSNGGIYVVTTAGATGVYAVLTRAYDWQVSGDVQAGMIVGVKKGTVNTSAVFVVNHTGTFVLDTTVPTFGTAIAAAIVAGAGVALAGATLSSKTATAAGTALTDTATQTIQHSEGSWRKIPTLGQSGALTLGTVAAVAGDQIEVTRSSTDAFAYAVINGGAGAGTLYTFVAGQTGWAKFQFDGTNWALKAHGALLIAATATLPGTMSAGHFNQVTRDHQAAGTTLTDAATETMLVSAGYWRTIPTLGQAGELTISNTGAVTGDIVTITRTSTDAHAYVIKDEAAVTLTTLPASKQSSATFQYSGSAWVLKTVGQLA